MRFPMSTQLSLDVGAAKSTEAKAPEVDLVETVTASAHGANRRASIVRRNEVFTFPD
jgi:hypothetical protein